jgi:hypothetical protein
LPSRSIPFSNDLVSAAEFTTHESGAATATTDTAPVTAHSQELSCTTLSAQLLLANSHHKRIIKTPPEGGNIIVCAYASDGGQHAHGFYGRFTETLVQHMHTSEDIEVMLGRVQKDLEECEQSPCIEVVPARADRAERFCLNRYRSVLPLLSFPDVKLLLNFTCQCFNADVHANMTCMPAHTVCCRTMGSLNSHIERLLMFDSKCWGICSSDGAMYHTHDEECNQDILLVVSASFCREFELV